MSRHDRLQELLNTARNVVLARRHGVSPEAVVQWVDMLADAVERYDTTTDCTGAPCSCKPFDNKLPMPSCGC